MAGSEADTDQQDVSSTGESRGFGVGTAEGRGAMGCWIRDYIMLS